MDNFGEQRMSNIRKRTALEKEKQAAKMIVRKKERKIAHGSKDDTYFARKYLNSALVAGHLSGRHALEYSPSARRLI